MLASSRSLGWYLIGWAALGLGTATTAPAAAVHLSAIGAYRSAEQISDIQQFNDVKPSDWTYQALANLIER